MSFLMKQQNMINLSQKQQKNQLEQKYVMDFFISETNDYIMYFFAGNTCGKGNHH